MWAMPSLPVLWAAGARSSSTSMGDTLAVWAMPSLPATDLGVEGATSALFSILARLASQTLIAFAWRAGSGNGGGAGRLKPEDDAVLRLDLRLSMDARAFFTLSLNDSASEG